VTPARVLEVLWHALSRFCRHMTAKGSGASARDMGRHPSARARWVARISDDKYEVEAQFWAIVIASRIQDIDEGRSPRPGDGSGR
jgi:hypothetical protein